MPSRVPVQTKPSGPVVMRQKWRDLLFLHWSFDADVVQRTLPPGLFVDCWQGKAWVGIVPFFMCGVRPAGLPAVPWLSDFLELNVRTYVRDAQGRSGVWFYSLDCNQPVAVWIARTFFHLPYFNATMKATKTTGVSYESARRAGPKAIYSYKALSLPSPAKEDSQEAFLVERYRLFSKKRDDLFAGSVWHEPYGLATVDVPLWSPEPLRLAGFDVGTRQPEHATVSAGVDVSIYPLRRVSGS